jgi:hypothetical protein
MKYQWYLLSGLLVMSCWATAQTQRSVARQWNEVLLEAIRNDFARPTVHARNLFHVSAATYDAWAAYDATAEPYFLGKQRRGHFSPFEGVANPTDRQAARNEAISYACYRLIVHRFRNSPGAAATAANANNLMRTLGYDPNYTGEDYRGGPPAALGNYVATQVIAFGLQDGANEDNDYRNLNYQPVNPPLLLSRSGNPDIVDPNRWQPLAFNTFVDQSGNEIPGGMPEFIGAEWGLVAPFSLKPTDRTVYQDRGNDLWIYRDPGPPCYLSDEDAAGEYQWNFAMVARWSAHLTPDDGVLWDISPASTGNLSIENFPATITGLRDFYQAANGGDPGQGYSVNPRTNQPYAPQLVPRGDYTRVLAEYWADGPDSETPPGHWFTILNYVTDHPRHERRFRGEGGVLDPLEWDVKSYFALGGAMHDAAVAVWSIKGRYDYIRPISAIRYMAERGQSTDPEQPRYHPDGLPLVPGAIEVVGAADALAGANPENVGKIKVYAWRGHDYIPDTTATAGVGWILAENWWPYQRPTFVTPAFAGYVSGHSTFSRAAAEVLTLLTGDAYFPGGMSEFVARQNEFLSFEEGPSTDVVLQWAKYTDASDQCSLSRIWGGIHPPIDDIRGRLIGQQIGQEAFAYAQQYFDNTVTSTEPGAVAAQLLIYPNPVASGSTIRIQVPTQGQKSTVRIRSVQGSQLWAGQPEVIGAIELAILLPTLPAGIYLLSVEGTTVSATQKILVE